MLLGIKSCFSPVVQVLTLNWSTASQWTYPQACKGPEHVAKLLRGSLAAMWHRLTGRKRLPATGS